MSRASRNKKRKNREADNPTIKANLMWIAVGIAALGAAMALYLADITFTIAAEGLTSSSACSINEWVNCDLVQASSYARLFGVPVAWWGLLFYVFVGFSALYGAAGKNPQAAAPYVAASFLVSILAVLFSILKGFNLYQMGLLCPVCVGMYAANLGLMLVLPFGLGLSFGQWAGFVASYVSAASGKESDLKFSPKIVKVVSVFLILFTVGGTWAVNKQKGSPGAATTDIGRSVQNHFRQTPRVVETNEEAPVWGNPDAEITIVEFADFQCPACRQAAAFFKPTLGEYEDRVKFVFMNFPLRQHALARGAASAAICSQEFGDFWGFHDDLFRNQPSLGTSLYDRLASDRGWDTEEFRACMRGSDVEARIEKELELGSAAGLTSTPFILVNGRRLSAWNIADNVRAILNEELRRLQ